MAQNSRETDLSAILGRSHPGRTPSSSLLQYRERQNHKSEELFQITKNPAGEKIAEEPAESLARHQNCQFRENVRGTNFKGSRLLKLLQAQKKKKSAKLNALRTFHFIWCRRGDPITRFNRLKSEIKYNRRLVNTVPNTVGKFLWLAC